MIKDNSKLIQVTSLEDLMPLIREQLACGKAVRFSPKGRSMLPMLKENRDSVVLSPVPERLLKYDLPLYQRENGKYVLHRIVEVSEDRKTYTMMGDHQLAKERGIRHDQIIGVVTAFYRNGRKYSVDNPTYKVYCRVWYHGRRVLRYLIYRRGRLKDALRKVKGAYKKIVSRMLRF